MTRYYDQELEVKLVGEFVEVRFGDVALMLTVDQAKDLSVTIDRVIQSAEMILRPTRPDYRVGD
jgi:hypothetical protein